MPPPTSRLHQRGLWGAPVGVLLAVAWFQGAVKCPQVSGIDLRAPPGKKPTGKGGGRGDRQGVLAWWHG